jgi:hypothetical protein
LYEERLGVMKKKRDKVNNPLMGDDVGSLHEERNEVNDSIGYQLYKLYSYRLIKI